MALTKVGIVYSTAQKVRRKTIVSDIDDCEVNHSAYSMLQGESWFEIPIEVYRSFTSPEQVDEYLAAQIGDPSSDICAVVDGNNLIVATVFADPIIDDHPDGIIIQDDESVTGLTYDFESAKVIS